MHILLSNSQAGPVTTVKQKQEEISRNHVQAFISGSVQHQAACWGGRTCTMWFDIGDPKVGRQRFIGQVPSFFSNPTTGWPISWRTWVGFTMILVVPLHPLPGSAWADGKLAELAKHLGKMVEHPKSKPTQPRFARSWATLYNMYTRSLILADTPSPVQCVG